MLPQCRKVFSIQISAITSFPPFIPCPFLLLLHLFLCLPCFFFFFFSRIFWITIQIRALFCNHHVVLSKWLQFSSVHSLSRVRLFATPWMAARQTSLSIINSWSSLKLMSIEPVVPSSHLWIPFCHPLLGWCHLTISLFLISCLNLASLFRAHHKFYSCSIAL